MIFSLGKSSNLFTLISTFSRKRRQFPLSNSKSARSQKRDRYLISKVELNFQISHRNKNLLIHTVFTNLVNFIKKGINHKFSKSKFRVLVKKIVERSSDSFIGADNFFQEKFSKFFRLIFTFSRKRKANSTIEQQSVKITKNVIVFYGVFPLLKRRQTPISNSTSGKVTNNVLDI